MTYLQPDSRSQVTIEYDDNNKPLKVHSVVILIEYDKFIQPTGIQSYSEYIEAMLGIIKEDVKNIIIPHVKALDKQYAQLFKDDFLLFVNPTGIYFNSLTMDDIGMTGRKIILDTYGGKGAQGGGLFSGKDSSKIERSGAYAARHIAKNIVMAGLANEVLIQVTYVIGLSKPINFHVNTYGTAQVNLSDEEISKKIESLFDMRIKAIEKRLKLRFPIYEETASYGHFGHSPEMKDKNFIDENGYSITEPVELFTWEKADKVYDIQKEFGLYVEMKKQNPHIYLSVEAPQTPKSIFDFGFLWLSLIRTKLPELYDKGFDLISQRSVLKEVFQNPDYKDLTDIQKTWRALVDEFVKAEQIGIKLNKYSYWQDFYSVDFIYGHISEFDLNNFLYEIENLDLKTFAQIAFNQYLQDEIIFGQKIFNYEINDEVILIYEELKKEIDLIYNKVQKTNIDYKKYKAYKWLSNLFASHLSTLEDENDIKCDEQLYVVDYSIFIKLLERKIKFELKKEEYEIVNILDTFRKKLLKHD